MANMRMRNSLRGLLGEARLLRQGAGEPVAQGGQIILCGVSNNHSGDGGRAGLKDTVRHVETKLGANVVEFGHFMTPGSLLTTVRVPLDRGERHHSRWAGVGTGAGAGAATSQEEKNTSTSAPSFLNIGFLNATSVMNWGKRNASLPVFRTEYLLKHDWNLVKRAEGVHFLVAYLHWDREQRYMPRGNRARRGAAGAGGCRPHRGARAARLPGRAGVSVLSQSNHRRGLLHPLRLQPGELVQREG